MSMQRSTKLISAMICALGLSHCIQIYSFPGKPCRGQEECGPAQRCIRSWCRSARSGTTTDAAMQEQPPESAPSSEQGTAKEQPPEPAFPDGQGTTKDTIQPTDAPQRDIPSTKERQHTEKEQVQSDASVPELPSEREAITEPAFPDDVVPERVKPKTPYVVTYAGAGGKHRDGPALKSLFFSMHGIASDARGNLYIADRNNHCIRKVDTKGMVTTIAGSGKRGHKDGSANVAEFQYPESLTLDKAGNIYVADTLNHMIRKIDTRGRVTTIAGSGAQGSQDGPARQASFHSPVGLALHPNGDLYVADSLSRKIRKIDTKNQVSTVAGTGKPGYQNGPALQAQLNRPESLVFDKAGNLYISDRNNQVVQKLDTKGNITPFYAPKLASLSFNSPGGMYMTPQGQIYIADTIAHHIYRLTPQGKRVLVAGTSKGYLDGPVQRAKFNLPEAVAFDQRGNLYITDRGNDRIRKLAPNGEVTTFAGSERYGFHDGPSKQSLFNQPEGVAMDKAGNLYVADASNNRIRKVDTRGKVTTFAGPKALVKPHSLAFGPKGNLYVAGKGMVWKITPNARVSSFSNHTFIAPGGITVSRAGQVYVSDTKTHQIFQLDLLGNRKRSIGRKTSNPRDRIRENTDPNANNGLDGDYKSALFNEPRGLAVDRTGNLYIADSKNDLIRMMDTKGRVTTLKLKGINNFDQPMAMTIDAKGNLYVCDFYNNRIVRITPQKNSDSLVGGNRIGTLDGHVSVARFAGPTGITVGPRGLHLYVADRSNHNIRKIVMK